MHGINSYLLEPTEIDGTIWSATITREFDNFTEFIISHSRVNNPQGVGECTHHAILYANNNPAAVRGRCDLGELIRQEQRCLKTVPEEIMFLIKINLLAVVSKWNIG